MCKAEERKRKRAERAVKRRKAERLARRTQLDTKPTKVAQEVAQAVSETKTVVTYDDLDGDQLLAYHGIHTWWDTQKRIGGVAEPLTVGGFAGTGKSTLLSIALPALKNPDGSDVKVKYCAYTGKASNVLMQKGLPAQTMHSLIYDCVPNGDTVDFVLKHKDDVDAQLIVVDEASMIPDEMRQDLESLGIPILYTGDHGQLPPVAGIGNVMADPIFKLEQPHRQALESGIIEVATNVRNRKRVKVGVYGKNKDVEVVRSRVINDTGRLAAADMVICYTNKKREQLNKVIRKYKGFEGTYPQVGEKLICVRNNKNTRMFNGLVLYVKAIKEEGGYLVMDLVDEVGNEYLNIKAFTNYFEGADHPKIFGRTLFDVFEFAYAITGHKSQGSQWREVVVVEEVMYRQPLDIQRRWNYTALTRASEKLTWIRK